MKKVVGLWLDAGLVDYLADVEDGKEILELVLEDRKLELAREIRTIAERRERDAQAVPTR